MRLISLVGLPGAGKSVVGKALARRLGVSFSDTDHEIEKLVGRSVSSIFELEGEAQFRELERNVLKSLCAASSNVGVLSTGGGVILSKTNRALLRASATVIYLYATPSELVRRLRFDRKRPLLQGGDIQTKLNALFEIRDPLYRAVADFVIETGRPAIPTLVGTILMQLELSGCIDPLVVPSVVDPLQTDRNST